MDSYKITMLDELVGTYDADAKKYPYVNGTEEQRANDKVLMHYAALVYSFEPKYLQDDAVEIIEGALASESWYLPGSFRKLVETFSRDIDTLYQKTMETQE